MGGGGGRLGGDVASLSCRHSGEQKQRSEGLVNKAGKKVELQQPDMEEAKKKGHQSRVLKGTEGPMLEGFRGRSQSVENGKHAAV